MAEKKNYTINTNCCFCSSNNFTPYYKEAEWQIVKCENCGLCYTNPRPTIETLPNFYNEEYFKDKRFNSGYYNPDGSVKPDQVDYFPRIGPIESFLTKRTSLLELGAARGGFLKVMRDRGWDVDGIEISPEAALLGKKLYNILLFNGILEEYKSNKAYDVVCMYQTLEHVYNPAYVIRRSYELLNKNGLLVIEVPNIESADMWFNKERKHLTYDLPRHLTHFTPTILSTYLESTGFKIEYLELAYPEFLNRLLSLISNKNASTKVIDDSLVQKDTSASTPLSMAKLTFSRKAKILRFIASLFPGWRFTIVARKV